MRCLTKEDKQMTKKHMKPYSTSCVIRKLKIKIVRCHYTPVRKARSPKLTIPNAGGEATEYRTIGTQPLL